MPKYLVAQVQSISASARSLLAVSLPLSLMHCRGPGLCNTRSCQEWRFGSMTIWWCSPQ